MSKFHISKCHTTCSNRLESMGISLLSEGDFNSGRAEAYDMLQAYFLCPLFMQVTWFTHPKAQHNELRTLSKWFSRVRGFFSMHWEGTQKSFLGSRQSWCAVSVYGSSQAEGKRLFWAWIQRLSQTFGFRKFDGWILLVQEFGGLRSRKLLRSRKW